jgi:hypothetical protein
MLKEDQRRASDPRHLWLGVRKSRYKQQARLCNTQKVWQEIGPARLDYDSSLLSVCMTMNRDEGHEWMRSMFKGAPGFSDVYVLHRDVSAVVGHFGYEPAHPFFIFYTSYALRFSSYPQSSSPNRLHPDRTVICHR